MTHTPAPWFLSAAKKSVVARPTVTLPNGEKRWTTRRICTFSYNDNVADATLITAAPDMLAALERLADAGEATLAAMDAYNEANGTHIGGYVFFEIGRGVSDARAAIAKALGRTPNEIGDEG